ncbi:LpqB family beta-propeller domain-containing protein [Corynebacterium sputi]|uniref:LpqB family beta-propeller domain-containing protein n=1 Tax=Corynebacterium sputi TaxID=489915 RepID=UPI0006880EE6|nr:LpqB family beta-propeller domain-containing protein [Corynebacterium sputi]
MSVRRRRALTAVVAGTALVLASCASLPSDSSPEVVRPYSAPGEVMEIPEPRNGVAQDVILRDFFTAMAHPTDDFEAARKFLTEDAAENWIPQREMLVLTDVNIISGVDGQSRTGDTYEVRSEVVGSLTTNGAYQQSQGSWMEEFRMDRDSDGQWLISELPDGIYLERSTFMESYVPHNIYFVDPTGQRLVPDRRWLYRGEPDQVARLMQLLRAGPRIELGQGVTTALRPSIEVSTFDLPEQTGTGINFEGAGDISDDIRTLIAAQTVWTLGEAGLRGPWLLDADGAPLIERSSAAWTRDAPEIAALNPAISPGDSEPLRVVYNGAIYTLHDEGAEVADGIWGSAGSDLGYAAIGLDTEGETVYAGVQNRGSGTDTSASLIVGRPGLQTQTAVNAQTLTRPSWSPGASSVWTVADGEVVHRAMWSEEQGSVSTEEVNIAELESLPGAISEFRIDPSGTQAAMLKGGQLVVATVVQSDAAPWALVEPRAITLPEGVTPVSLTWNPDSALMVGDYGDESPVWRVQSDGSSSYALPRVNLTAPIAQVASTSYTVYALDEFALMELVSDEGDQQFWRAVPEVPGRAAPIVVE